MNIRNPTCILLRVRLVNLYQSKGVRKAIAQNMVTSVTEIPHGWMMLEVDATNLVKLEIIIKIRSKRTKVII